MILLIADDMDVLLAALSDPIRRRVVELLGGGPRRSGELSRGVGVPVTTMSRHLKQLRESGIVDVVPVDEDARIRVYSLRGDRMIVLRAWIDQVSAGWSEQLGRFKAHAEGKGRAGG